MNLVVAAIGKAKNGPFAEMYSLYSSRIEVAGRNIGFSGPTLVERDAGKIADKTVRLKAEGELLQKAAPKNAIIVALDEKGENLSSTKFAAMLRDFRDDGPADLVFAIGGADGHTASFLATCRRKLAFGPATWPHMLVRVMLVEQIYRSMTIIAGHPYHRE